MTHEANALLVVDDEEMNRDLLSRRLTRAGYPVLVAEDAQQALSLVGERQIDLILLDHMMPVMSGIELLKLLRATYSAAQLPVIMVTALNESERIAEALNMGANDYITKPVDFPVALARIRSQLNRKRAEDALRESEERYALAARGARDGLWDWDLETGRIYFSPRWKEMLGYQDDEIGADPEDWLRRVHKEDRARLESDLSALWQPGANGEFVNEHRILHKDGGHRWMLSRAVVQRGKDGLAVRMAGSQTDITQNKAFDPLTGLPNRVMFNDAVAAAIERHRESGDGTFAVLFLDLDRFKDINDSLGHLAGDQLLIAVAGRLRAAVRCHGYQGRAGARDLVARLGGDEFAILLDDLPDAAVAQLVAERALGELQRSFGIEGRDVFTSASIGIALSSDEYQTPVEILRDADTAMYRAKSLGKARCELFDAEMRASALARLELENDLPLALEQHQFLLHYQPKIRLSDETLVGFEALLRWQHPARGLIAPAQFIPLAEETGLIVPIGIWVLREACCTMREWQRRFPADPPLEISVNLSVRQFRDPLLVENVEQILCETGLPPSSLQLEVTESVLVEDAGKASEILKRLKALGVGLKIDDFGTGYSALNSLHQLPFDTLKIDRSFIMRMPAQSGSLELVRTIVSLGASLGMEVVAEGVETEQQLNALKQLGCRFGQGYYFSKPVAASQAAELAQRAARGSRST